MRMSTWMRLAVALLAGCSFEPPALQPPGDGSPPVVPDASPVDGAIDAAIEVIDAAPPDARPDKDGDGVADPEDNCPEDLNPDQANCDGDAQGDVCDESSDGPDLDGDRVADACDNCPSKANQEQETEMDDDEVGDACDPRPTEGGDTIAYFDGFDTASAAEPPGWTEATGTGLVAANWRVENGALVQDAAAETILYLSNVALPADVVVETRLEARGALEVPDGVAASGLVTRYTNVVAGDAGVSCTLEQRIDQATTARVRLRNFLAGTVAGEAPWQVDGQQTYTIVQIHHGSNPGADIRCTVTPADTSRAPVEQVNPPFGGPPSGTVGLRVVNGQSAFEYVLVYGLGGPLPAP
jgi:hypothetical protein